MRNLILTLLITIIQQVCVAEELSYPLTFVESDYQLTTQVIEDVEYTALTNIKMSYDNVNDAYDIPVSIEILSIPLNASNIEVSIIASEKKLIKSNCLLIPHQTEEETGESSISITKKNSIAESYRPNAKIINQGYYDGDKRVIAISICPFEYDSATKQLFLSRYCTIVIKYDNNSSDNNIRTSSMPISRHDTGVNPDKIRALSMDELLTNNVCNLINNQTNISKSAPLTRYDENFRAYEYMIITSRDLTKSFRRLGILRKLQGYDVGIVAIEDILSQQKFSDGDIISGINDDAGKLRMFLIYAFEHWGTKYVFLGGNSDIIPVRYGTAGSGNSELPHNYDDSSIPSDLYYSDLNSSWNTNGRSDWYGKEIDQLDYYPELYVGRLLCKNSEEVDNYIDKVEVYEMRPGKGDPVYLMSVTEMYQNGFGHQKILMNREFDKLGFGYNNTFIETSSVPVVGSDVISNINTNTCGVFTHHGHANPRSLHTTYDSLKMYHNIYALDWQKNLPHEHYEDVNNGLNNLTNYNKPFIMQSLGCITAPLDHYNPFYYPDSCNVAQSFTMGKGYGGVAYLGNSRPGLYLHNASDPTFDRFTVYVMQSFWDVISKGVKTAGQAEAYSKCPIYAPYLAKSSAHKIRLTHNLIGDPALKIWTTVPKSDCLDSENYIENIQKYYSILSVSLNSPIYKPILADEINDQKNNAIYYMPNTEDRLPFFSNLALDSLNFNSENTIYCEDLYLGSSGMPVQFSGNADIIFRAFGTVTLDNIIIKDNAIVTIVTNGDVNLNNANISSNGYLKIRCEKCNIGMIKENNRIIINEYNPENKRLSPEKVSSYVMPMVVDGRSWEYLEETVEYYQPHISKLTLRIEGVIKIDGQQYAVLNAYYDDQTSPAQNKPYGYLRETQDGKVYARTNPEYSYYEDYLYALEGMEFLNDGTEFLLADYNDFYASQTYGFGLSAEKNPLDIHDYISSVNTLKVWQLITQHGVAKDKELRLVEKVGYVWPDEPCNIFTPIFVRPTGADHKGWLYLQCVKDSDGSTIYEIDNMYSSGIAVTADDIPAVYYDLQGRKLNPASLVPGVYIRRHGAQCTKVLVK